MREIKFRGRYEHDESNEPRWVLGNLDIRPNGEVFIRTRIVDYLVAPDSVGQFTGLKDKNGKEIYEGDVLDYGDYTNGLGRCLYTVFWDERNGRFAEREVKGQGTETGLDGAGEVIGNIYENPELLKV